MNRRVIALASLIAAAIGLQAPVAAQDHYIAPAVVYTDDDRKRAVDDEITGGQLAVGTFIADNFALEGILGLSSLSGVDDLDLREIGINGRYVFRRDARLSPYLIGGFGLLDADSRLFDTEQSAYLTYGLGIDIRFGDGPLSLRLETRKRDSDEDPNGFNDHITSLGVAYAFGPTPLPSPAPSAAVNRSDSDGDCANMFSSCVREISRIVVRCPVSASNGIGRSQNIGMSPTTPPSRTRPTSCRPPRGRRVAR